MIAVQADAHRRPASPACVSENAADDLAVSR